MFVLSVWQCSTRACAHTHLCKISHFKKLTLSWGCSKKDFCQAQDCRESACPGQGVTLRSSLGTLKLVALGSARFVPVQRQPHATFYTALRTARFSRHRCLGAWCSCCVPGTGHKAGRGALFLTDLQGGLGALRVMTCLGSRQEHWGSHRPPC